MACFSQAILYTLHYQYSIKMTTIGENRSGDKTDTERGGAGGGASGKKPEQIDSNSEQPPKVHFIFLIK